MFTAACHDVIRFPQLPQTFVRPALWDLWSHTVQLFSPRSHPVAMADKQ